MPRPRENMFDGWRPAPYPVEGPQVMQDRQGRKVLRFMYASFVFTWPENTSRVSIEHGTVSGENNWKMPDHWGFELPFTEWTRESLAEAAKDWHRKHEARFQ